MKNSRIKNGIMRIVQGIIIGAGAILPGISGGVLAVVFGIYRPAMELLTHPRRALQRYWRMLLAVGIGWAIGFLGGGSVILALFHQSETVATCLFIGLILGTLPDLWHEAGTQGRGNGSYISLIVSFLADELGSDLLDDGVNGVLDALAEVAALVAIATLDGLERAGGRA